MTAAVSVRSRRRLLMLVLVCATYTISALQLAALDPDTPAMPGSLNLAGKPIVPSKGGHTYLPGNSSVSPTGEYHYEIPLDVPEGRNGMKPTLSLAYTGGLGNGPLGVGWKISGLSAISRCAKSLSSEGYVEGIDYIGFNDYGPKDGLCLDGQKLVMLSGGQGLDGSEYRTEHDVFSQITAKSSYPWTAPDSFTIKTKSGLIRTYLPVKATRVLGDLSHTQVTPAWLLSSESDRSGNSISYTYVTFTDASGGTTQVLPSRIDYTKHTSNQTSYRYVQFDYDRDGARPDREFAWSNGIKTMLITRLRSITMYAPYPNATSTPTLAAWTYRLLYTTSPFSGRSLLTSVQKCGAQGATPGCTWKLQFSYVAPSSLQFTAKVIDQGNYFTADYVSSHYPLVNVLDADGDGADDILFQAGTPDLPILVPPTPPADANAVLFTSRDSATGAFNLLGYKYPASANNSAFTQDIGLEKTYPLDVDGDGTTETYIGRYVDFFANTCENKILHWDAPAARFNLVSSYGGVHSCDSLENHLFADLDGDGRLDHLQGGEVKKYCWHPPAEIANDCAFAVSNGATCATKPSCCDHVSARSKWSYAINKGDGLFTDFLGTFNIIANHETYVAELQGDGRAEIYGNPPSTAVDNCLAEDAASLTMQRLPVASTPETLALKYYPTTGPNQILGDFNGDGLQDVFTASPKMDAQCMVSWTGSIRWNTGTGYLNWVSVDLGQVGSYYPQPCGPMWQQNATPKLAFRAVDMNRDGRTDLLVLRGDSTPGYSLGVLLSKGDGRFTWAAIGNSDPGLWFSTRYTQQFLDPFPTTKVGDFNRDGFPDVVRVSNDYNSCQPHAAPCLIVLSQVPQFADRLQTVKDEATYWPRETVTYSAKLSDKPEPNLPCAYPKRCGKRQTVVRSVESRAHLVDPADYTQPNAAHTLYYSYEDPVVDMTRGFLGFRKFRVWDPTRPSETVTIFDNHASWPAKGAYPYALRPILVTEVTPVSNHDDKKTEPKTGLESITARVVRTKTTSQVMSLNAGLSYVDLPQDTTRKEWEQQVTIDWGALEPAPTNPTSEHIFGIVEPATPLSTVYSGETYDNFGNLTFGYGQVVDGAYRQLSASYDNLTTDWLIGLLRHRVVTSLEPNQPQAARTMDYDYDSLGRLSVIYREKVSTDTRQRLTVTLSRDAYGLVTKSVATVADLSIPAREQHFEYEPLWPGQPNERVFQSQFWEWSPNFPYKPSIWTAIHPAYGVEMASMDSNGVRATSTYDDLGRPTVANPPLAAQINFTYGDRWDKAGCANGTLSLVTIGGQVMMTAHDARGRTIQGGMKAFDGTNERVDTAYDNLGRLKSESRPYKTTPSHWTIYSYDPLDRLHSVVFPDNTYTTKRYTFFTETSCDPSAYQNEIERDVNGRLVRSSQYSDAICGSTDATKKVTTQFGYEAFGVLHQVTDPKLHVTTFNHDSLGRLTGQTDPDAGSWQFAYNGFGDRVWKQHNATDSATTTYVYDALGRLKTKTGPEGTTTQTWDSQPNGIGKLASASSVDGVKTTFSYDAGGRSTGFVESIGGTSPVVKQTYDTSGRLQTMSYPSIDTTTTPGLTLTYKYNASEYLAEIDYSAANVPVTVLWSVYARNLDGAQLQSQPGNGLMTYRTYDPYLGRLQKLQAKKGSTPVFDLDYTYYANGLLQTRNDNITARNETFFYDTLGRLVTSQAVHNAVTRTLQYEYDSEGNMRDVKVNGVVAETNDYGYPSGVFPHAITKQILGSSTIDMAYDPYGRQTTKGSARAITKYTDFDLPKAITANSGAYTLSYDAGGTRAIKSGPTTTCYYIEGLYERRIKSGATTHVFHVFGPDGPIADLSRASTNAPFSINYLLTDALGTVDALADTSGNVGAWRFYEPFGKRINADGSPFTSNIGPVKDGFIGAEHDDEFGLINLNARLYDPELRRMLSPDPIVKNTLSVQDWNRYSYGRNSPLNFKDPSGLTEMSATGPSNSCSHNDEGGWCDGPDGVRTYFDPNGELTGYGYFEKGTWYWEGDTFVEDTYVIVGLSGNTGAGADQSAPAQSGDNGGFSDGRWLTSGSKGWVGAPVFGGHLTSRGFGKDKGFRDDTSLRNASPAPGAYSRQGGAAPGGLPGPEPVLPFDDEMRREKGLTPYNPFYDYSPQTPSSGPTYQDVNPPSYLWHMSDEDYESLQEEKQAEANRPRGAVSPEFKEMWERLHGEGTSTQWGDEVPETEYPHPEPIVRPPPLPRGPFVGFYESLNYPPWTL